MRFGLLWHSFSSGNLGVGALSLSNLMLIDEAARRLGIVPEYLVIGSSGPCDYPPDSERYCYRFVEFNERTLRTRPHRLFAAIRSCDAVFDIGEGDSFSDIYGARRLFKLLLSKGMAIAAGVPLVLSPQTIGPFKAGWAARGASWAMDHSVRVFARDHQSFAKLVEMQVAPREEVIDVAFRLPFTVSQEVRDPGRLAVGLSASALLHHGGYQGNLNQFGLKTNYARLTGALIEALLQRGCEVHLVPHVIPRGLPEEDDFALAERLRDKYRGVKLAPRFRGPIEAKSYIAAMDFFVGARMHATIAAFSAGVPVVPLAYSRKFAGLYESLGYPHVVDLKRESEESALELILDKLDQRAQLRDEVQAGGEIIRQKLTTYGQELEALIGSLVRSPAAYQR